MKVSRTVTYAVQALLQLSVNGESGPVPCGQLAKEGRMPERFLLQILRDLVTSGILRSVRGVDGGYQLARQPASISLEDVFEAVNGTLVPSVPPLDELPDFARQKLLHTFEKIAATTRASLTQVKLSDLIEPATRNAGKQQQTS
ncbi:MAG: Rrf2 family transcriptional regulator [Planctomycetales bacterium]|nr:Rrf2 family transcriptional regulator [Planctomycetales bacterium]